MSLKSIDITKVKRLSLKDVKLPAQEVIDTPIQVERPPTEIEIAFNKTALNNPVFKPIAERLDLKVVRVGNTLKEGRDNAKKGNISQGWSNEIKELETYFGSIKLPAQPIKLNKCSIIMDCLLFIESHFSTVKRNNGNKTFLPYLNRLQELKKMLDKGTIKETEVKDYYSISVNNENKVI